MHGRSFQNTLKWIPSLIHSFNKLSVEASALLGDHTARIPQSPAGHLWADRDMCCGREGFCESRERPWREGVTCVQGVMLNQGVVEGQHSRGGNSLDKVRDEEGALRKVLESDLVAGGACIGKLVHCCWHG